jgi:acylphosphatase
MAAGSGLEARHVFYSGRVQGVGFRYTARHIAQRFAVTGFVRNLPDGRVELLAEGPRAELDQLLTQIAEQMADHIRRADIQEVPVTGRFDSFEIAMGE